MNTIKDYVLYYTVMVNLDGYNESTLDNKSSKIYVPSKTEGVNLNVFNMITRISE